MPSLRGGLPLLALTFRSHCKSKHRRHPTHRTVQHLPDVGWSQSLDLPPSAARPALPRGEITWFPPPRSACSRPFLAVFIQILKKNGPRETAAATLPRLCRRAPGRLPQPLGTRGRPLTDFGQPPPASSLAALAALGTPALLDVALSGARHSESVRRRQHTFSMATAAKLGVQGCTVAL